VGTVHDWMSAAIWGLFWAAGMLLLDVRARGDKPTRPIISIENLLSCVFFGLGTGVGATFRWKPFRWYRDFVTLSKILPH
jgi:hypothetical protein